MTIDDTQYWERYYSTRRDPGGPSKFAQYVLDQYLHPGSELIELGCGNGRDSVFLAKNGIRVKAIDQCQKEIKYLESEYSSTQLQFMCDDFTSPHIQEQVSYLYSRFSVHAIRRSGWEDLLDWSKRILIDGGYILLEFRGKNNELFGKGSPVEGEDDAFIFDGHFRRFLDLHLTAQELQDAGFEVVEAEERIGFSPYNNENETFARLIGRLSET